MRGLRTHGFVGVVLKAGHAHAGRTGVASVRVEASASPGSTMTDGNAGDPTSRAAPVIKDRFQMEPVAAQ